MKFNPNMKMKFRRQKQVLELILSKDIGTQEELVEKLNGMGYCVTQATVSRDIRELRLSKISTDDGVTKYVVLSREDRTLNEKYSRVLKDGFLSMDTAQNILVVKTVAGMAMAVAAAIDAFYMDEIVGSIAGDDTIMIAIKTVEDTETVISKISNELK